MKNMANLFKQAQQMQAKIAALQNELNTRELEVVSQGGAIKIKINGKQEITDLKIDRECLDPNDVEMFQEILKKAMNQAIKESQDMVSKAMSKVTGGLNLPGMF
jgi:DNA-binding YbaB/EbfC family protein